MYNFISFCMLKAILLIVLLPKKSSFCLSPFAGFADFSEFSAFFAARLRSVLRRSAGGDFSAIDVREFWWRLVVLVLRTSQLGSSSPSLSARYQHVSRILCVWNLADFKPLLWNCVCKMSWLTVNCGEREKNRAISFQTKLRSILTFQGYDLKSKTVIRKSKYFYLYRYILNVQAVLTYFI